MRKFRMASGRHTRVSGHNGALCFSSEGGLSFDCCILHITIHPLLALLLWPWGAARMVEELLNQEQTTRTPPPSACKMSTVLYVCAGVCSTLPDEQHCGKHSTVQVSSQSKHPHWWTARTPSGHQWLSERGPPHLPPSPPCVLYFRIRPTGGCAIQSPNSSAATGCIADAHWVRNERWRVQWIRLASEKGEGLRSDMIAHVMTLPFAGHQPPFAPEVESRTTQVCQGRGGVTTAHGVTRKLQGCATVGSNHCFTGSRQGWNFWRKFASCRSVSFDQHFSKSALLWWGD